MKPTNFIIYFLDIWNYIESLRCTATDLSQRVVKAQRNVEQIAYLINQWKDCPLFTRVEKERTEPLLNLSGTLKEISNRVTIIDIISIQVFVPCNTTFYCRYGGSKRKTIRTSF